MDLLVRNPVDALEAPRWQQLEMRTLDAKGVAALLQASAGTELRISITVLIGTSLRRGDLFGLRWSDVDLDGHRLTVRRSVEMFEGRRRETPPKTARSARTLALAPFVVITLRQQKSEQSQRRMPLGLGRDESAYVFERPDGEPWNPDSFAWAFAELVRRSELPKIRLHDLRHSHATIALGAGTDLKTISAALGHSTIAVTANTYLHATEALQRSHADRIDDALGAAVNASLTTFSRPLVPQPCHAEPSRKKKPRGYRVSLVAPTGFEPVLPP
jgi:integrase